MRPRGRGGQDLREAPCVDVAAGRPCAHPCGPGCSRRDPRAPQSECRPPCRRLTGPWWFHRLAARIGERALHAPRPLPGGHRPVTLAPVATVPRDAGLVSAIELRDVTVVRGGRAVLCDISLRCEAGSLIGLVGPSGSGKTTLMRALVGVQRN